MVLGRHHLLGAGTVAILTSVALGLPVFWLTWATFRDARRSAARDTGLGLAEVANQLAIQVRAQWEAEAAVRRLNDPYPLPVSWDPADPSLTDSWDSLLKLASSGAGWPAPPPAGVWAAGAEGLAGTGNDLVKVLAQVPTGRLVVLGEPGAGKTTLMVRLLLDLLARRSEGGPVPFLASIASWNPANQMLQEWLAAQLVTDYPVLAALPADVKGNALAAALLAADLILPILDGLDEIPDRARGPAITQINDALRPGQHLVVTCRSQQYQDTTRPDGGVEVTLRAAAAVQLRPLDAHAVRDYLCDDAGGPDMKERWLPVVAILGTDTPAGQSLETPLMVGLARAIYNPRPGELTGALREPKELCDPGMATRAEVDSLLFDAFIPAAYRNDPNGCWKAEDAERWLVFLARHLEHNIGGPDLAWWQLTRALPATTPAFMASFWRLLARTPFESDSAPSPAVALVWHRMLTTRIVRFAVSIGIIAALLSGIVFKPHPHRLSGLLPGLAPKGLLPGLAPKSQPQPEGLVGGFIYFIGHILEAPFEPTRFMHWFVHGFLPGLVPQFMPGRIITLGLMIGFAITLVIMLIGGLAAGWPGYEIARILLALRNLLPWRLMHFLHDAHRRGVLRQAGAVYQFRHIELQHRLAARPSEPTGVG